jgi:hypothetical protein
MTPKDFIFKLTVPADAGGATVVAVVAGHAVEYAGIEGAAAAAFVERVRAAAAKALTAAAARNGCLAVFTAADGKLTVTIDGESVSQPLPA